MENSATLAISTTVLPRARVDPARLGLHGLTWSLLALHAMVAVVVACAFARLGLSVTWAPAATGRFLFNGFLLALWLYFYFQPGTPTDWLVAETLLVAVISTLFANTMILGQYAAAALHRPYADSWLALADARIGVHVPTFVVWMRDHAIIGRLLTLAYFSHAPQFMLTVFALAILRDRDRLWEFAFHFHFCLFVAVAAFAIWPAACAPAYYGFTPIIDVGRAIAQIQGFHDGSLTTIGLADVDGLVSFPSFHVAGALIATWAFRRRRWIVVPLAVINAGLIAATFMTGLHYFIDVLAAFPLFAMSVFVYRRWALPLLTASSNRAVLAAQV
jgi:hypothetical protein